MPLTQFAVRPTTSQGLVTPNSLRTSSAPSSNTLANTTHSSESCTPISKSDSGSKWIRPLFERSGNEKHRNTIAPAISGVFEAVSVPEEEDTSPAQSNTSIDIKSRRLSFMSFILSTAPTMEEAIRIGTQNQVSSDDDYCVKTAAGYSRRQKILHFFGKRHKKQGSTQLHNDFLVPGLELKDSDRKILDRLDFSTLSKFQ